ncbi:transcriptional regulator with XRE-family HTH domain [Clostridium beijerinckii]|uniref:helix-turn-helix domain-containing protein n=1 Tax=Clostridium beijerinckii TaxID=1520 RepID=UPI0014945B70|nr:helix-turn-helix transcriptional regulator [Clostridium beijerinckii]NOW87956.1 transcriptional regulator with XRE-family HTH domain [Clostridium beijerinckii]
MNVNQRIKQVRQELKLSQAKFAKAISISAGYLASIELENRAVNERIIRLVSVTFSVSETWLKSGIGDMFRAKLNYTQLDEVAYIFQQLKPEFQEYVLKQIKELLELQNKC